MSTAIVVGEATETHTVAGGEALDAVAVLHVHPLRPGEELAIITAGQPVAAIHTCLAIDALRDDDRPRRTRHRPVLAPARPVYLAVDDREDATPRLRMYAGGRGLHCPGKTTTAPEGAPRPRTGTRLRQNAGVTRRLEAAHLSGGGAADRSLHLAQTGGLRHVHGAHLEGGATGTAGAGAGAGAAPQVAAAESEVEDDAS